uniref:Uncharacterized protein n=1 Tax=Oryza brachyantha TaxID=4533 RepID=J3M4A0_ORYBR
PVPGYIGNRQISQFRILNLTQTNLPVAVLRSIGNAVIDVLAALDNSQISDITVVHQLQAFRSYTFYGNLTQLKILVLSLNNL